MSCGYFAHGLNAYGRTGEPCHRCGTLTKRVVFMNRSAHFCLRCQRPKRSACNQWIDLKSTTCVAAQIGLVIAATTVPGRGTPAAYCLLASISRTCT
ncbi:zinc finger domain-containing protein [Paeniglutamicibacter sp. NPDC091659]|uniref:zinc finger domain-containing protein n=1 Tax=Paeniglutamicibacter sp. NPDC091659 TaxID=3364389 RepID=UPI0037F87AFD